MERSFFILGTVGFILSILTVFYVFGNILTPNILISQDIKYIQNFSMEGQLVSMIFWTVLSLTGGFLWISTLFRTHSIMETSIVSLSLGALVISLSIIFLSQDVFFLIDKIYSGMLTESTLLVLATFVFVGFLSRVFREIISSGTSSLGIREK